MPQVNCPICKREVVTQYLITIEVRQVPWHHCMCGAIFHTLGRDNRNFGAMYLKDAQRKDGVKERYEYMQRVYLPMIEELTYGRKFLDVGFTLPHTIEYLKARGWITNGVDLVPNDYVQGDFESIQIPEKFDYIMMGHCLESFADPKKALKKAYDLLEYNGLLLITHPNPEMIYEIGLGQFGYWDYLHSWVYISKNKLEDMAKRTGFEVITSLRNISQRFTMYNDLHLLLQRKD